MFEIDEHKKVMLDILLAMYSDNILRSLLGFKGGTMAYLFYELPRMSVDLDFDLMDIEKKKEVYDRVKMIVDKYKVLEAIEKKNCLFFLVDYGFEQRKLKIEISKRGDNLVYERRNYFGMSFLVMKKEAMVASKMAAALGRKRLANRDIFDLWYFFSNGFGINENRLKELTEMNLRQVLNKLIKLIKDLKPSEMLFGLGDLLDNSQKDMVRVGKMKDELLTYIKIYKNNI